MARTSAKEKCLSLLRTNLLVLLTLLGVGIGFGVGFGVREFSPSKDAKMWLGMVGELYLRMLKMMIVPLIIASVISGTASMDPKSNGKISAVCFLYIIITNCLPTIIGSVLVVLIKPGIAVASFTDSKVDLETRMQTQDIFADLLRNLFPENLVAATFEQAQTKYTVEKVVRNETQHNATVEVTKELVVGKTVGSAPSSNILGLVIVCMLFGIATSTMKNVGKPFLDFFSSASEIILRILRWLIWSTPIGVISLISKTIVDTKDIEGDFKKLGMYFLTVMSGLLICAVILQPIAYFVITRKNPFMFLLSLLQSTMICFATSSTAIAIPESLKSLEDKNDIDKRVSRFVVPLSAALGRCGSSMYITVSCLFVVQMLNIEVDFAKVILVCILTTFSTLAIPSVTGASLITVIILLTALNIPVEAASLLYALEWFLDRARTVCNYYVQMLGAVLTFQVCKSNLKSENIDPGNTDEDSKDKNAIENAHTKGETKIAVYPNIGLEEELTHI